MGSWFLATLAATFIGTEIARSFFDNDAGASADGHSTADADSGDSSDGGDFGSSDAGGGDLGGGDFGGS